MGGLTRSLKYAGFRAGRVVGICLLMAVGFVFYFTLLDGGRFTLENLLPRFPMMMLFIGNLMFLLYGMLDVAIYTNLTLTYGCTRKNAMISSVYMHLLIVLALEAVLAVSCALIPAQWAVVDGGWLCRLAFAQFLIAGGLALVMGVLINRFGKVAYIIAVFFAAVGGGVFGGLVGFNGGTTVIMEIVIEFLNLPVLIAAGIVWYAVMAVICWLCTRKMEVRV